MLVKFIGIFFFEDYLIDLFVLVDDDLIFALEEDIEKEISHTPTMASSNVSFPYYSSQATSIKNRSKSPSRCRFGSARHVNLNRHVSGQSQTELM